MRSSRAASPPRLSAREMIMLFSMVIPATSTASIPPWPAPYIKASSGPRLHRRVNLRASHRPHSSNTPAIRPAYRAYSQRFPCSAGPSGPPRSSLWACCSSTRANTGNITQPRKKNRQRPPVLFQKKIPSPRGRTTVNIPANAMAIIVAWATIRLFSMLFSSFLRTPYTIQKGEGQGVFEIF